MSAAGPGACPECLRRARLLARLAPYIEKVATGAPGTRSPELLRLSNEDLVDAVARKAADRLLDEVAAIPEAPTLRLARGGRLLGLLPARRPVPVGAARCARTRPGR